jgi:hypothetical protein
MDHAIVDLIDEFTAAGWDKWETLKALTKVVCDHALAYQQDRDQSSISRRRKSTGAGQSLTDENGRNTRRFPGRLVGPIPYISRLFRGSATPIAHNAEKMPVLKQ